jgi:hypothetical protein
LLPVLQNFTDFIGHEFTDTLKVAPETHTIGLHINISYFRHELIENGMLPAKVINFDFHSA